MRRPVGRLALTLLALATLISGYYLGQLWQRQALQDLTAVVYPSGRPLALPEDIFPPGDDAWRLFVTGDTTAAACEQLLRDYGFARNRLAAAPGIQARVRLVMLAFDRPSEAARERLGDESGWIDVIAQSPDVLEQLAAELGIRPTVSAWCTGPAASAVLVSPRQEAWALIPYEAPAAMARNIRGIIEFVE
jgi:hypothetical protein